MARDRPDTWRDRFIEQVAKVQIAQPESDLGEVIEVVSLLSGITAEMYYKELTTTGLNRLKREIKNRIREFVPPERIQAENVKELF